MNRIVSATDVRTRFDEIMRQAKTSPVIVKRYGKPEVVIVSVQEYDQLMATAPKPDWWKRLEETHEHIRQELNGRELPDPAEMLRQAREERDTQLFMAQGEENLRQLASKHGLNWDKLSEDEREQFVDNLLHEK